MTFEQKQEKLLDIIGNLKRRNFIDDSTDSNLRKCVNQATESEIMSDNEDIIVRMSENYRLLKCDVPTEKRKINHRLIALSVIGLSAFYSFLEPLQFAFMHIVDWWALVFLLNMLFIWLIGRFRCLR